MKKRYTEERISKAMFFWSNETGVKLSFIQP